MRRRYPTGDWFTDNFRKLLVGYLIVISPLCYAAYRNLQKAFTIVEPGRIGLGWSPASTNGSKWEDDQWFYFNHLDQQYGWVRLQGNGLYKVDGSCGKLETNAENRYYHNLEAAQRAVEEDCAEDGDFNK